MESAEWPSRIRHYSLNYPIGQGACGLVWSATVTDGVYEDREVALKIINFDKFDNLNIDEIKKEINIMSEYSHENLISSYVSFIDKSEMVIVMPLIDAGSCADIIKETFSKGIEDESIIAAIIKSVLLGLDYLHKNNEMHRDIKAGNVFIKRDGSIYLGDFGVAASLKTGEKRKTLAGSPCWMAPEVIEQFKGYDFSADIWSLGITAIELAEGKAPYVEMSAMKILLAILNSDPPSISDSHFSKEFKDFVDCCLQKDASKRWSAEKLLKHKFINKA